MVEPSQAKTLQSDAASAEEGAELPEADEAELRSAVVGEAAHGERLDKLLVAIAGEFSRNHLQSLVTRGHVRVDGAEQRTASRRLRAGQRIDLELIPTAESQAFRPQAMELTVVYEDEDLLVIDKPAGLVVHPAAGNWSGTLLNALLARHAGAATLPRAGIVHRLDKDTSGLMIVGKSLIAVTALVRAIGAREVHRSYLALSHGVLDKPWLSIEAPIGRDPRARTRMAVLGSGKAARTDIELIAARRGISALRCTLHSGRTHQIRVHLASRGHPLVADALYGGAPALGLSRQALHAARLSFAHPVGGRRLDFEAPMPVDMATAWAQITNAT
jgi:23S rRNA pseudouridine1911/1915/1917 synthase